MREIFTKHHIIARANPLHGNDSPENIVMLKQKFHRKLHDLFALQTPGEQIQTVMDIAKTALAPGFHRDLTQVLGDYQGQMYKPWITKTPESKILTR